MREVLIFLLFVIGGMLCVPLLLLFFGLPSLLVLIFGGSHLQAIIVFSITVGAVIGSIFYFNKDAF